jgi:transcriptional regulator with PAS, ATPase and Fis domain
MVMALPSTAPEPPEDRPALGADLDSVEREHILRVLQQVRSKAAAARRLGISRRTLYRRLEFHKVPLT